MTSAVCRGLIGGGGGGGGREFQALGALQAGVSLLDGNSGVGSYLHQTGGLFGGCAQPLRVLQCFSNFRCSLN